MAAVFHTISVPSPFAFADVSHPFGQAAALGSVVDSDVVNVASKAALDYLTDGNKQQVSIAIGDSAHTTHGRGIVEEVELKKGISTLKFPLTGETSRSLMCSMYLNPVIATFLKPWNCLPSHVETSQALAAGILGETTIVAKVLRKHQEYNIQQLLKQLVVLQSKKTELKNKFLFWLLCIKDAAVGRVVVSADA